MGDNLIRLLSSDKALHFLWCFFLTSIWLPLGIVFAVGKEVYDYFAYGRHTKGFWKMTLGDLLADILGIILAVLLVV